VNKKERNLHISALHKLILIHSDVFFKVSFSLLLDSKDFYALSLATNTTQKNTPAISFVFVQLTIHAINEKKIRKRGKIAKETRDNFFRQAMPL
jgi:hypothetical protein